MVKSRDDLCREDIFPSSYKITQEVEADANYKEDEDGDMSDNESNGNEDVPDFMMEDEELDVYMVDDEWGTLIT